MPCLSTRSRRVETSRASIAAIARSRSRAIARACGQTHTDHETDRGTSLESRFDKGSMVVFRHTKDPCMNIARGLTRVRSDAHGPCDGPGDVSRVTIRRGIDGRILAHERPIYEYRARSHARAVRRTRTMRRPGGLLSSHDSTRDRWTHYGTRKTHLLYSDDASARDDDAKTDANPRDRRRDRAANPRDGREFRRDSRGGR